MKKAIMYAINLVLVIWGLIMCIMNISGIWNIHWVLATLPLYVMPTLFFLIIGISSLSKLLFGVQNGSIEKNKNEASGS